MPDPDLEITEAREGELGLQKISSALRTSVWSKKKEGPGIHGLLRH